MQSTAKKDEDRSLGPFDSTWHSKSQLRGPGVTEVVVGPSTRVLKEAPISPSDAAGNRSTDISASEHTIFPSPMGWN